MKISLTKKEYRLLVDMLYLADWMMNAFLEKPGDLAKQHIALHKKILSYSKDMDADDIIEYDKETDQYYELRDYEEKLHKKYINKYDEQTFWEELLTKLALRDLIKSLGVEQFESLTNDERITQLETIRESYAMEFEEYGIERLQLERSKLLM